MDNQDKPINKYNYEIVPKIKEIDVLLKTNDIISIEDTSKILNISQNEIIDILIKLNTKEINSKNFLSIMVKGSSFICKILKREIECGSPYFYTPKDISYIYELDYLKVKRAFDFLEIDRISTFEIPAILIQI